MATDSIRGHSIYSLNPIPAFLKGESDVVVFITMLLANSQKLYIENQSAVGTNIAPYLAAAIT
jgi:hypothetical protein